MRWCLATFKVESFQFKSERGPVDNSWHRFLLSYSNVICLSCLEFLLPLGFLSDHYYSLMWPRPRILVAWKTFKLVNSLLRENREVLVESCKRAGQDSSFCMVGLLPLVALLLPVLASRCSKLSCLGATQTLSQVRGSKGEKEEPQHTQYSNPMSESTKAPPSQLLVRLVYEQLWACLAPSRLLAF